MIRLAHIVNPLIVRNPGSDLRYAQPIAIRSLQDARDASAGSAVTVTHYAACYEEDAAAVPAGFQATPYLQRSVLDCVRGESGRRLPLLKDILDRLYAAAPDADYLIYSNIDVGVWPDFYRRLGELITDGFDAFQIGRRTLPATWDRVEQLPQILEQDGRPHFGLSCFVFPRAHYPGYRLYDTCIGLQPVGVTLLLNMIHFARRFENFANERLTFHLGDDGPWTGTLLDPFHVHNERTLDRVARELATAVPAGQELLATYQRWRSNYVIDGCSSRLRRDVYRLARQLGLVNWVAMRYSKIGPV